MIFKKIYYISFNGKYLNHKNEIINFPEFYISFTNPDLETLNRVCIFIEKFLISELKMFKKLLEINNLKVKIILNTNEKTN